MADEGSDPGSGWLSSAPLADSLGYGVGGGLLRRLNEPVAKRGRNLKKQRAVGAGSVCVWGTLTKSGVGSAKGPSETLQNQPEGKGEETWNGTGPQQSS